MRGVHFPPGRTDRGDYEPPYPFNIKFLSTIEVDPRDWEPRFKCNEFKRMSEIEPDKIIANLPLDEMFHLWVKRGSIMRRPTKHSGFDVLMHFIFPKKEERTLAQIAIWMYRDRLTDKEIRQRLGKRRGKPIHHATFRKWKKYITMTINRWVGRIRFLEKAAKDIEEEYVSREPCPEEDARELIGG